MDTYGVEVDGALTGKVGVFFTDIRDRILPFLRRQETLTVSNKSYHAELSRMLGDFRAKLVSTLAVVEELSRKDQETIQGRSFREILGKLIIPVDDKVDADAACDAFHKWAAGAVPQTASLLKALDMACANYAEGVDCMTEFADVFRNATEFWTLALDMLVCDYVFEHVDMKFKTKFCRDLVKFFPEVIEKGSLFLSHCEANKFDFGENAEHIVARAQEIVDAAENRLDVYTKVKKMISTLGVATAFDQWKDSFAYSKSLAAEASDYPENCPEK